jgi:hypothetical protein
MHRQISDIMEVVEQCMSRVPRSLDFGLHGSTKSSAMAPEPVPREGQEQGGHGAAQETMAS